jgi:hypothetical protein
VTLSILSQRPQRHAGLRGRGLVFEATGSRELGRWALRLKLEDLGITNAWKSKMLNLG